MKNETVLIDDVIVEKESHDLFKSMRGGYFLTEESAINDSYTHEHCEKHDITYRKYSVCRKCREENKAETYNAMQKTLWDGVKPVYSDSNDKYYFSIEELMECCEEEEVSVKDMMLYDCDPCNLSELENEYWCDDWYDGAELPKEIQDAMDVLNNAVREHGKAFSWCANMKKAVYVEE